MTFIGLTWDHPRGYDALAEAAKQVNAGRDAPLIHWEKQPLEGFESAPIADLAARHDLLVLDHPHIGEAVADNCLIPLDDLFPADQIAQWATQSVGPSLRSYRWGGKQWALPLDVATQVMVRRPDVVARAPTDWAAIQDIAMKLPVAQSLAGPHAFLTLISICAADGHWIGGDEMLPEGALGDALDHMHWLYAHRPVGSEHANPIQLLQAMANTDQIALIPLVFGYVTYSGRDVAGRRLAFSDSLRAPGGAGGVLGGTGIAFSNRCAPDKALLDHIAWLLSEPTQTAMIPAFGGQPSARAAWQDGTVNANWGGFYNDTLQTGETALLRPRFDGYIAFQTAASAAVRAALDTGQSHSRTIFEIKDLWRRSRDIARGDLDDNRGPNHD